MDKGNLTDTPIIHFDMGFEDMRMNASSTILTTVIAMKIFVDAQLLLSFDLTSLSDFPSLKRRAIMVPQPWSHTNAALTTIKNTNARVP